MQQILKSTHNIFQSGFSIFSQIQGPFIYIIGDPWAGMLPFLPAVKTACCWSPKAAFSKECSLCGVL